MKNITLFLCILCIVVFGASCRENTSSASLAESELYFKERLSSISADGDSAFWIGSETGDIWYMDERICRTYNIGSDRIYKVVTDSVVSDSRVCWVSSRNSGLQKWIFDGSGASLLDTYSIKNKGINYSVYDILLTDNHIYAATSQGLYAMSRSGNGQLDMVYPPDTSETANSGSPFIINNICRYKTDYLLCATHMGMVKIDSSDGSVEMTHKDEQIYNISVYGDKVYLLADGRLYIEDIEGNILNDVKLSFTPRIYYKSGAVHYFLNDNYLWLSNDLESFLSVPLRRKVPQFCTNVITTDIRNGYTLLITENALWSIPLHLGVFNNNGEIVASCSNGDDFYYVNSNNDLYYQDEDDNEAFKIFEFSDDEMVSRVMADDEYLYYISNNRFLKRIKVGRKYISNMLFAMPETVYQSPTKITASCLKSNEDGSVIYLGIQDDLVRIDESGRVELIDALHNKYITSFHLSSGSDNIYISTLNDGIYYGSGKSFHIIGDTEEDKFIRDISVTEGYRRLLMVLTNHQLMCKEYGDSISLKGYKKILNVNDSLFYVLPEFGLVKYVLNNQKRCIIEDGRLFNDISFNPEASFLMKDTLYLGSNIGVLKMGSFASSSEKWVKMESSVPSFRLVMIVITFIVVIVLIVVLEYFRRRNSRKVEAEAYLEDIGARLDSLYSIVHFAGENDEREVCKLKDIYSAIDINAPDSRKRIKSLSEQIMRRNRDIALGLSKHLEKQMSVIDGYDVFERPVLMENSRIALETEDLDRIVSQVESNEVWINNISGLKKRIASYSRDMTDTVCIEKVNGRFMRDMFTLMDDIKRKELSELEGDIKNLYEEYNYIFTDDALEVIGEYISEKEGILNEVDSDQVTDSLLAELEHIRNEMKNMERIKLLRILYPLDCHIIQVIVRKKIALLINEYSFIRNGVEKENEERIIKKFNISLSNEIAEKTQHITEQIQKQISILYDNMAKTDRVILSDVLELSNFNSQSAKVLALLIANPKVKRLYIPGMLCLYGNLNPVVSRLMNNKLKVHFDLLNDYVRDNPTSLVYYILHLI